MAFRFIHTADIHLDSPLRSLALRNPALSEIVGTATRLAFIKIIDMCLEERVDALLIAGDLYDGEQTSIKTARLIAEQFGRLDAAGIGVFIIKGNHDALSKIARELVMPPCVHVFGGHASATTINTAGKQIAIHGISFAKPHAPESLLDKFKAPIADAVNIGMLHTSLAGAPGHDLYAPCSVAELQGTGFQYWALGHLHQRAVYQGASMVVMPGMPQGRDIGEAGEKSVTLVTVADDGTLTVEERATSLARFERVLVNCGGITDWPELVDMVGAAITRARAQHDASHLVLRLSLEGNTPLAWRLRRDMDLLIEGASMVTDRIGTAWIDKIENGCIEGSSAAPAMSGPLADLSALIESASGSDSALAAEIASAADDFLKTLPKELRALLGNDPADVVAARAAIWREGAAEVLAKLITSDAGDI